MRDFVLYANKGVTSSDFYLKDLPGSGGRMDLIARCVISALWLSRDMRRDTRIHICLNGPPNPPLTVTFDGEKLRRVSPDERNVGGWIRKALKKAEEELEKEKGEIENLKANDGIFVSQKNFYQTWQLLSGEKGRRLFQLHEEGKDIREREKGELENPVLLLGDHMGIAAEERKRLEEARVDKLNLGPYSYFASGSITIVHNELDRRGL